MGEVFRVVCMMPAIGADQRMARLRWRAVCPYAGEVKGFTNRAVRLSLSN